MDDLEGMNLQDDLFKYELSEEEWKAVRYALMFFREAVKQPDPEWLTYDLMGRSLNKLGPENWAGFRLSRERAQGLSDDAAFLPGPSPCCMERLYKPSVGHKWKWRCYGCGLIVQPDDFMVGRPAGKD